ncbi:MAG TPA: phosphoenolpyruvate--protein phosphotransferase [Spirochaetales bacterium]|nr:phosphoenolpyruvate--protein phosphotransferase [Spirochaetales bacterium]
MREYKGIPASPGIAAAPAFVLREEEELSVPSYAIAPDAVEGEWNRFLGAVEKAKAEVEELRDRARAAAGEEQAAIFEAHLLMLSDPDLFESIQGNLASSFRNIERVIVEFERGLVEKLAGAEDPYLQARAADIHDVARRILSHLLFRERFTLADLESDVVLIARDLLPSDMISLNRARVKAIATEAGGRTSHVAILARAFEIPAVLGLGEDLASVEAGDMIVVDGSSGLVTSDPDAGVLSRAEASRSAAQALERELALLRDLPAATTDGRRLLLKANIEVPEEAVAALGHGAEGVGLFRSEFLFLQPGHVPGEDEQYRVYRRVIEIMDGRPVTIRTLDIGGDKVLPELGALDEKNPLLGWRAIRFCLAKEEVFLTQLRAILRAAAHGDARIMFPMISAPEELERARELVRQARAECRRRGHEVPDRIPVGIMIEVPSAALASDILARRADFFSIGTNDLIQYTMAVDRGNEKVAYLHDPFQPSVLRLVRQTIESAKGAGIPVGMCGEMASDPAAALLLLGLGLEEFSMSSSSLPAVKRLLRSVSAAEAEEASRAVMAMSSSAEVSAYLAERAAAIAARRSL